MADVEYKCFVGGLACASTEDTLNDAFVKYDVVETKIINDCDTGRSRGFGFVTFKDEGSMKQAIEKMNGTDPDGRNITVNEAQSRNGGGRGGGGYGCGRRDEGGGYGGGGGCCDGGGGYGGGRDRGYGGSNDGYSSRGDDDGGNMRN